jgi:hypothetical protein
MLTAVSKFELNLLNLFPSLLMLLRYYLSLLSDVTVFVIYIAVLLGACLGIIHFESASSDILKSIFDPVPWIIPQTDASASISSY